MNLDFSSVSQFFGMLTLSTLLPSLIYLLGGLIIIKLILNILNRGLKKSKIDITLHKFLRTAVKVVLYFVLFMIVAGALGIQVTSLVAILSVAGLAISLSIQNLLSNVLSGLLLLTLNPFKVGDYVDVGGTSGTVKEIGFVYTKIVSIENIMMYIPNGDISSAKIVNYSAEEKRRFNLRVGASYDSPPEKVKKVLLDYLNSHPQIDKDPAPFVSVAEYKDSYIEYVVRAWADNSIFWDVHWEIQNALDGLFKKNDLEMTYPHINVHIEK